MHGRADALFGQLFDAPVPVDGRPRPDDHWEQVPGLVLDRLAADRQIKMGHAGQGGEIAPGAAQPPFLELRGPLELGQAEGGVDVGHVVLEAGGDDIVFPAGLRRSVAVPDRAVDAVEPHRPGPGGERGVVRRQHAAFAGGDGLVGVEAEAGRVAEAADHPAGAPGREGVGRVLDDADAVTAADLEDPRPAAGRLHRGRLPAKVNDHQRFDVRVPADGRLDDLGRQQAGPVLDIQEDGVGAEIANDLGRGGEGHGRDKDPVAGLDPGGLEGQMEGRRAGVDGDRVLGPDRRGEAPLELDGLGPGRQPAALEDLADVDELVPVADDPAIRHFHSRETRLPQNYRLPLP